MWTYGLNGITLGALDHGGLSLVRLTLWSTPALSEYSPLIDYPWAGILIGSHVGGARQTGGDKGRKKHDCNKSCYGREKRKFISRHAGGGTRRRRRRHSASAASGLPSAKMPEEGLEPSRDCSHRILSTPSPSDCGVCWGEEGHKSALPCTAPVRTVPSLTVQAGTDGAQTRGSPAATRRPSIPLAWGGWSARRAGLLILGVCVTQVIPASYKPTVPRLCP